MMKKLILAAIALTIILLSLAACGGSPTPVPTLPPPPTIPLRPTAVPQPTATPQPSATRVPPTSAPRATATSLQPTASAAQPTLTPTTGAPVATVVPATATAAPVSASPTAVIPPGLYVTSLRLDPVNPAHRVTTAMFVSFLNTAGGEQNVRWVVYVYRADNPARPFAQSPINQTAFRPGATPEQDSLIKFNLGATGQTTDFLFARVAVLDTNNQGTPLNGTDGKTFERGFTVDK